MSIAYQSHSTYIFELKESIMTNYKAPVKSNWKKKTVRFVLVVLMFVVGGLTLVAVDQIGQRWQEHRAGFDASKR
jgi:hypothetical protein